MSDGFLVAVIVALVLLAIFGFVMVANNEEKTQSLLSEIEANPEFDISASVVKIPSGGTIATGIALDNSRSLICLLGSNGSRFITNYDLYEVQVICEGKMLTKTSRVSQLAGVAVGGVVGGGIGAIIGGLSGATHTTQNVKQVVLKLLVNDVENPIHEISFIEMTNLGDTPPSVAIQEAQSWHDLLSVIIRQCENEMELTDSDLPSYDEPKGSLAIQLRELNELRNDGVLSDDEFKQAKAKILSSENNDLNVTL